jgi:hypothetical protein
MNTRVFYVNVLRIALNELGKPVIELVKQAVKGVVPGPHGGIQFGIQNNEHLIFKYNFYRPLFGATICSPQSSYSAQSKLCSPCKSYSFSPSP